MLGRVLWRWLVILVWFVGMAVVAVGSFFAGVWISMAVPGTEMERTAVVIGVFSLLLTFAIAFWSVAMEGE